MSDTPQLNYAPPPPMHFRRSFRRWVYLVVSLMLIVSGWWWIPPAWRRVELLYWQRQCLNYEPPVGQIVADSQSHLSVSPLPWRRFYTLLSPPGFNSAGTVFLHEMKRSDGARRLVAVELTKYPDGIELDFRVFFPGNALRSPAEIINSWAGSTIFPGKFNYKAIAGQLDPADRSHFTFELILDGERQIENGWLTQYDTVEFAEHRSK